MIRRRNLFRNLLATVTTSLSFGAHAAVTFDGLDGDLEKNARALMAIASASCDVSEWRVERLFRDSEQQLQDALEALGYYRYSVEKMLTAAEGECWQADFTIVLGEPVRVRNVTISLDGEASKDPGFVRKPELMPQEGVVLNHGIYERYKASLVSRLSTRGYFDARLTESRVAVDAELLQADVVLKADSGPRYYFGDVTFDEHVLTPELLAGYVRFRKGDPYDAAEISKLHELLNGSGYFGSVSIQAEPVAGQDLEVPVIVSITPGKRRVFTGGAGYATDTGIQGRLGYTNRRRNAKGHQFDARLFLSSVDSELTGNYRWPRGRPDAEWVDIYGGFLRKRTDTSKSDKTTLGARISRNRTENWLESPYFEFTREDFLVGEQLDTSNLVIPGIKWETTIGRNLQRVPKGHRISVDLRGAHENLLSDTTFGQATVSAKWITTVGLGTRLLARADVGATAKADIEELPATVRFFAGGDTSVRGYGFETIGPEDDEGNVVGGSHLAVFSLEADWRFLEKWAVAAFVDSGSAFDNTDIDMHTGVGLGVRWYSPLGPIRIDVAHPLDDPDTDYRFHITLGPDL